MALKGQFPAVIQLASLDGNNGFELLGGGAGEYSGYSVSNAGDINNDGISDVIIGAYFASTATGKAYVVFGKSSWITPLLLSSLNGTSGFALNGVAVGDATGISVNHANDVNGDGISDVIIGAYDASPGGLANAGKTYVVFGKSTAWPSAMALSSLNGANGFALTGAAAADGSGISVDTAGDVNGDGFSDLIIGAYGASPGGITNAGKTYVVFGKTTWTSTTALSSLNGVNGFELDGVAANDRSGLSVSTAGDINNDGLSDVIIGAYGAASQAGKTYVVFGKSAWSSPVALSSLNGLNGFELDGVTAGDGSGYSVNVAGDINNDGIQDIIIGAWQASSFTGKTYVVFGKTTWTSPISLSSLNGTNGFLLNGAAASDASGYSVSVAGDINNDGIQDIIIGAPDATSSTGKSYVVFGKTVWNATLSLSTLNGINGFEMDGEAANDNCGRSVNAAGDVNGDGVSDIIIGAPGASSSTGKTYIVFGDSPPVLVNNYIVITQAQRVTLNTNELLAYDFNHANTSLIFIPTGIVAGQFELISNPGIALANFTQQQINSGSIQFVQNGSAIAPGYSMTVKTTGFAYVGPYPANVTFSLIAAPTLLPSTLPSSASTAMPTLIPTIPTSAPSVNSSMNFSLNPTINPSMQPSALPTLLPSMQPSTGLPTQSSVPSTSVPTSMLSPTGAPTLSPSLLPSLQPTFQPSAQPTLQPGQTNQPSLQPSVQPTTTMPTPVSLQPTFVPSRLLSSIMPTAMPSILPSATPSFSPTSFAPSALPTASSSMTNTKVPSHSPTHSAFITGPTANNSLKVGVAVGVAGASCLGFSLMALCLNRSGNKKLQGSLKGNVDHFEQEVVNPVAEAIFKKVKIVGFCGVNNLTLIKFKAAIRSLLKEIEQLNIDINIDKMSHQPREELINAIATQTKAYLAERRSCGSKLCYLFAAQASPSDIGFGAASIAGRVADVIIQRRANPVEMTALPPQEGENEGQGMDMQLRQ